MLLESWLPFFPLPEKLWDSVTGRDFRSCPVHLQHLQLQLHDILVPIVSILAHTHCLQPFGGRCCTQLQCTKKFSPSLEKFDLSCRHHETPPTFSTPRDVCGQELWPLDLQTQHHLITQSVQQLEEKQSENLSNQHWLSAFKDPLGHSKSFRIIHI